MVAYHLGLSATAKVAARVIKKPLLVEGFIIRQKSLLLEVMTALNLQLRYSRLPVKSWEHIR